MHLQRQPLDQQVVLIPGHIEVLAIIGEHHNFSFASGKLDQAE